MRRIHLGLKVIYRVVEIVIQPFSGHQFSFETIYFFSILAVHLTSRALPTVETYLVVTAGAELHHVLLAPNTAMQMAAAISVFASAEQLTKVGSSIRGQYILAMFMYIIFARIFGVDGGIR